MDAQSLHDRYIAPTYGSRQLILNRGKGIYLYDEEGNSYVDLMTNFGVNILGHNNKQLNDAVCRQMEALTNLHGSFTNERRSLFAQRLVECAPEGLDYVFFCNSGTEAVEAAIKFSRLHTKKSEIIAAHMGYHGKTLGSLSLTKTMKKYNEPYEPLLQDVQHFSFGDADDLKSIISDRTAAVILEPIQGEGGIKIPGKNFFKVVKDICKQHNALLIIDEIQTGMGRTGTLFAGEQFGIRPDIMCLAKGLAGGIPIGATLITEEIANSMFSGCHTNTFGGNPLACAAGIATLDYIKDHRLLDNALRVGTYFMDKLKDIESPVVREVRGRGLMIAIELKRRNTSYAKGLQDEGVLVIPTLANVLRLLPPLIMTKEDVDAIIPVFKNSLT